MCDGRGLAGPMEGACLGHCDPGQEAVSSAGGSIIRPLWLQLVRNKVSRTKLYETPERGVYTNPQGISYTKHVHAVTACSKDVAVFKNSKKKKKGNKIPTHPRVSHSNDGFPSKLKNINYYLDLDTDALVTESVSQKILIPMPNTLRVNIAPANISRLAVLKVMLQHNAFFPDAWRIDRTNITTHRPIFTTNSRSSKIALVVILERLRAAFRFRHSVVSKLHRIGSRFLSLFY